MHTTKKANEVKPGDMVVERDGYALEVVRIEKCDNRITFTLQAMTGPVSATVYAHSRVRIAPATP